MSLRLELLQAAGLIAAWYDNRAGLRHPLLVNGRLIGHYRPDHYVRLPDGTQIWLEVKGRISREWPLKRRLIEACCPGVRLIVVRSQEVDTWTPGR